MATRLRKVRRQRGSRTHGWGQITQHRHSGSRGGTGMAGMHKHKWSYTVKYAPDHFGHNQFRPPKRVVTNRWLNLYDLERLAHGSDRDGVIDLTSLGFDKLLGQGEITRPYKLKIARASASAVEKVNAAGGSIEMEELHRTENTPDTQQKDSKAEKNKDTPAVKRRS